MVFRDPEDMNKENDDVSGEQNIFSPLTDLVSGALAAANISESVVMSGVCVHPPFAPFIMKNKPYILFFPRPYTGQPDYFSFTRKYNTHNNNNNNNNKNR
jgi:hypothetical protein